jgi:uncharacterized protein (DUF433 family)
MKDRNEKKLSKKSRFPEEVKVKAVSDYRFDELTEEEILEKYQITRERLKEWNRWYQRTWLNPFYQQRMKKKEEEKENIVQLKKELEGTLKQLQDERLRVETLERLIKISERELGISLKKSFGKPRSWK